MNKKYLRYSDDMLMSLGYNPNFCKDDTIIVSNESKQFFETLCLGKFKEIIKVLYNSADGSLDNDYKQYISSGTPVEVREFVNNILMLPTASLINAPDSDAAFDMIVPRSVQNRSALAPYINELRQQLTESLTKSN